MNFYINSMMYFIQMSLYSLLNGKNIQSLGYISICYWQFVIIELYEVINAFQSDILALLSHKKPKLFLLHSCHCMEKSQFPVFPSYLQVYADCI